MVLMTRVLPYLPPRDLRKFKESKKHFDKVSEEKEAALARNAQAPRNKQHEVEEATNILTATRKCFRHIVLDYVLQVPDPPRPPLLRGFSQVSPARGFSPSPWPG